MSNSAEAVPLLPTKEGRWPSSLPRWQSVALLLLIGWLYASILARLFLQWVGPHHDPNFEHGIFVPLFALFLLWQDRRKLKAIAPSPSWTGLPLVALGLLMLALGVLGAELFFSRVLAADPSGGPDPFVSGMDVFSRHPFPLGFSVF